VSRRLTYRFGPLERRGILGPVRSGQALALAAGLLGAIIVLNRAPSASGVVIATLLIGAAAGVATLPLGGRTAEEWAPVMWAFAFRRLSGRSRLRSKVPIDGLRSTEKPLPHQPPAVRDVRIVEAAYRDRPIGVISERRGSRVTAVLLCRVVSFSLLDAEAQERRLARWGSSSRVLPAVRFAGSNGWSGPHLHKEINSLGGFTPIAIPQYRCAGRL
jgi:hypothetical protein